MHDSRIAGKSSLCARDKITGSDNKIVLSDNSYEKNINNQTKFSPEHFGIFVFGNNHSIINVPLPPLDKLQIMELLPALFTDTLGLSIGHFEIFRSQLKTRVLKKKDYLIREGSVCDFIGVVSSGTLRSYVKNNDGEFNNDFYFDNNFVTAYTSYLTRMPTNCNIEALADSTIQFISFEKMNALVEKDISFLKVSKYISDIFFMRKCRRETSFLKDSALERLERLLLIYPGIEQRVSQYHIASYLGVKPESLSRIKLLTYINK